MYVYTYIYTYIHIRKYTCIYLTCIDTYVRAYAVCITIYKYEHVSQLLETIIDLMQFEVCDSEVRLFYMYICLCMLRVKTARTCVRLFCV